jgi:hypothetical protein
MTMKSDAWFSENRMYRYRLSREWNGDCPRVVFVMLNPSTADANKLDPTCTRCLARSLNLGGGALDVVNIFAFRSTDPNALIDARSRGVDIVGEQNDFHLTTIAKAANVSHVICGWGQWGKYLDRGKAVVELLTRSGVKLYCLGLTADGHPKHPLYIKTKQPLQPFTADMVGTTRSIVKFCNSEVTGKIQ